MLTHLRFREYISSPIRRKERERVEEILTPSQVAALLQIHVKTVYRLTEEGVIPGSRVGRSWRFRKSHILDLVSNKQKKRSRHEKSSELRKRGDHN
jgi:excisionase family DNA binding protein